jgi:acetolactate synthase-1/2/3 large subunit
MVRQWQEFFYERRYKATPLYSPDFVKLADAFDLPGAAVRQRAEVVPTIRKAREHRGTYVINFCVEQEDSVFPMVPAGADLHAMIRRPSPLVETAQDL